MISKLILGTVQFGMDYGINNRVGKPNSSEVKAILNSARRFRVVTLDNAEAYGEANQTVGEIIRGLSKNTRATYKMISKFHLDPEQSVSAKLKTFLDVFGLEKIWCLQFHRFQDAVSEDRQWAELSDLKRKGLIEKIGVSLYTNEEIEQSIDMQDLNIIQVPFNLFDNVNQKGELLARARSKGKEVHARSVFLQGLFFCQDEKLPSYFDKLLPWLSRLRELAPKPQDRVRLALGYALGTPCIDRVLVGVDSLLQWQEIVDSVKIDLTTHELQNINQWRVEPVHLLNPSSWPARGQECE